MSSEQKLPRWYFGGLSSAMSVCFTHPLDLIKVHLQTQTNQKVPIPSIISQLYKSHGLKGFYSGISASVFRQLTYSTVRFAFYDTGKVIFGQNTSFVNRIAMAFFGGVLGGYIGTPPDKVNVRMQNDMKLPPEKCFNYKNIFDGLIKIYESEGFKKLFSGGEAAALRAGVMAIGQISFYDELKRSLLETPYFEDNLTTHFTCSFISGALATAMTQPLDVVKTRIMNSKPGEFRNVMEVILFTAQDGPLGFFKGFIPAFLRIGPQTILTFLFYEQLRLSYGYRPSQK